MKKHILLVTSLFFVLLFGATVLVFQQFAQKDEAKKVAASFTALVQNNDLLYRIVDTNGKSIEFLQKNVRGVNQGDGYAENFLDSPTGDFTAYTFLPNDPSVHTTYLVVKNNRTQEEKKLEYASDIDEEALVPLIWSKDESFVYARKTAPTEGDFIGIYRIPADAARLTPVKPIDDLGLVITTADASANASGYRTQDLEQYFGDTNESSNTSRKRPATIYRVALDTEEVSTSALRQSRLDGILSADPIGQRLLYTYNNDLWLYDNIGQTEAVAIPNIGPQVEIIWNQAKALVISSDAQNNKTVYLFDGTTGTYELIEKP